jgi:hypothetical protein
VFIKRLKTCLEIMSLGCVGAVQSLNHYLFLVTDMLIVHTSCKYTVVSERIGFYEMPHYSGGRFDPDENKTLAVILHTRVVWPSPVPPPPSCVGRGIGGSTKCRKK